MFIFYKIKIIFFDFFISFILIFNMSFLIFLLSYSFLCCHKIQWVDILKKTKNKDIVFNVTNIYNRDNKSLEELKFVFNKKLLNMIYNLEKNDFYKCKNKKNS